MKRFTAIILILITAGLTGRASAIELSKRGSIALLSGDILTGPGDVNLFQDFLAKNAGSIRVLELNSKGGSPFVATEIGLAIRKAGLVTLVDAAKDICFSSCTLLFSGGAQRHYINAGNISDGIGPFTLNGRGLGYHQAGQAGPIGVRIRDAQIRGFDALGTLGAVPLVDKALAGTRQIYHISGSTALSLGIATSLSRP